MLLFIYWNLPRFKSYVIEKEFEGYHFKLCISDLCGKDWYDDDRTSTPETAFIKQRLLKKGDIVADCGAHHGIISLLSSTVIGKEGKVFSFEPLPKNAETINTNIKLNQMNNIRVENLAVGNSTKEIQLKNDSNALVTEDISSSKGIQVRMTSLDEYFTSKLF